MNRELELLQQNYEEMIQTLQKTISFDTTRVAPSDGAPFGVGNRECLEYVLKLGEQLGFSTYNCDGYAGHIDFPGSGNEVVGVLGHLDVVPAKESDGWITHPFGGEIIDGKIYGRGAMDDKGPMIACLYALKALKDSGYQPNKTIRLIFGCDEESGMECVKYYFKKVKAPDISFSPDGDFPVINREKGIFHFDINFGNVNSKILDIYGGERANVVCGKTVTKLDKSVDVSGVTCQCVDMGDHYELTTIGKNAHASTPAEGVNSNWEMFSVLSKLFPADPALQFVAERLTDYTGARWGIDLHDDESGNLTCNIGVVRVVNNKLMLTIDVRFPVTYNCEYFTSLVTDATPYPLENIVGKDPLFVPSDSQLVTTLIRVYDEAMSTKSEPLAIGGGTYSRCLPNCVAFGPLFPGEEQTIHMPNEYIIIDNYKKMAEIFMNVLKELSN